MVSVPADNLINMDTFRIDDRTVGPGSPTYVIAEAGLNHDGDFDQATSLIDAAADAGADAVKFQTFRARELYVDDPSDPEARNTIETFDALEMPYDWIPDLASYAEERNVTFLSTPFDEESADVLDEHVPAFKIASSTLSHHAFLEYVAEKGKPMIVSTGVHTRDEIEAAADVLADEDVPVAFLHCVSSYPTPLADANVRMVSALRDWLGVQTGLSDHTEDPVTAPSAAVALGGTVVEKHITVDNDLEGGDHAMALEPDELERMVQAIRDAETVLGAPYEGIQEAEAGAYENIRRSVYAVSDLVPGDVLTAADVKVLRSNGRQRGIDPAAYETVVGATVTDHISQHDPVTEDQLDL
jgi:N-acetylneuraminate synthase